MPTRSTISDTFPKWTQSRIAAVGCAVLVLGAYFLVVPHNHTEAEDAYWFAYRVRDHAFGSLFDVSHLLYLPLMKALAVGLHLEESAFELMLYASKAFGFLTVCLLALFLRRRCRLALSLCLLSAALLAVSYGFWRYSNTPEVYAAASFTSLLTCYLLFRDDLSLPAVIGGAVTGAVAVLFHLVNLSLIAVAVPAFFVLRRQYRHLLTYGAVVAVLVGGAYAVAWQVNPELRKQAATLVEEYAPEDQAAAAEGAVPETTAGTEASPRPSGEEQTALAAESQPLLQQLARTTLSGGVALGQSLVSGNFLFGYSWFRSKASSVLPHHSLEEEKLLGRAAPFASRLLPPITLAALLVLLLVLAFQWARRKAWTGVRSASIAVPVALWLATHTLLVLLYGAGNVEHWITAAVPLWITGALVFVAPLYAAHKVLLIALALVLAAHNYAGGMLLMHDRGVDYNSLKAQWLVEHTSKNDLILTGDANIFSSFLKYHSPAQVVSTLTTSLESEELIALLANPSFQHVYATENAFTPPPFHRRDREERYEEVARFSTQVRECFVLSVQNELGSVHTLQKSCLK